MLEALFLFVRGGIRFEGRIFHLANNIWRELKAKSSHRHGNRASSKMFSNRCWQQAFHRSNTHAWEVSPVFILPRYGKRLQTSSSWNISHLPCFSQSSISDYVMIRQPRNAMYFTPSGRKRGEVQRNMSTGWSLVSTSTWYFYLISTGRDLKANIPLIEWAPIPVFDDDPTCYLNAWDFIGDTIT